MDDLINETLQKINHIHAVWEKNNEDEDGDRNLSDSQLAMEAIGEILEGVGSESGAVRQFMAAEA